MTESRALVRGPFWFYGVNSDVLAYIGEGKYANTITIVWPQSYTKYYALLYLPQIDGGIPPPEFQQLPKYTSFMVGVDKLPLLFRIIPVMHKLMHKEKKEEEKKEQDTKRNLHKAYTHKLDHVETVLLSIVAGVDHHITSSKAYELPGEKRPTWKESAEISKRYYQRLQDYNNSKANEEKQNLDKTIYDWLCGRSKDDDVLEMVQDYANTLMGEYSDSFQRFTISDNKEVNPYFDVIRNYLAIRDRDVVLLRGDLIDVDDNDRGVGLLIYDGANIIDLNNSDDRGFPPEQFQTITEFPTHYWFGKLAGIGQIFLQPSKLHIDKVEINPEENYKEAKSIYGEGFPDSTDERDVIAALKASYNGKQYIFLTDTERWRQSEEMRGSLSERGTIPVPPPTENDIRNWFLTQKEFIPYMYKEQDVIYMGRFDHDVLRGRLTPLQEEQSRRKGIIGQTDVLLPELYPIVSDYTAGYYE